jgi:hypothetical protein
MLLVLGFSWHKVKKWKNVLIENYEYKHKFSRYKYTYTEGLRENSANCLPKNLWPENFPPEKCVTPSHIFADPTFDSYQFNILISLIHIRFINIPGTGWQIRLQLRGWGEGPGGRNWSSESRLTHSNRILRHTICVVTQMQYNRSSGGL